MAKFVAISGPSATGKTALIDSLSTYPELFGSIFSPDMYEAIWSDLVEKGYFGEFSEINKDSEYLCIYLLKIIDYYEKFIEKYKNINRVVFIDGCWLDFLIYANLQMWYTHMVKDVQLDILNRISALSNTIDMIYFTKFDENKQDKRPYHTHFKLSNIKFNRPLEMSYYSIAENLKNAKVLPSSDVSESSIFIIEDLKNLGYL